MSNILLIIFIIILIVIGIYMLYRLYNYNKSLKLKKRFDKYSLVLDIESPSLIDKLLEYYKELENDFSKKLIKTHAFDSYSRKYSKYSGSLKISDNMNYLSNKIYIGTLFVFLLFINIVLTKKKITLYLIVLSFLLGFFIYDIYLYIIYKYVDKRISDDMSTAIVIMNNSFKSGLSIVQAIDMVSSTMDGLISDEFKKMSLEISSGLELEQVFKRFSLRVPCSESLYLASFLSVLNETGGDIVSVFNSIEKNSIMRKKLREELNSASSQSRLVFKILVVIPPLLIISILLLNSSYFNVLFTTGLGISVLIIILLLYILYIYIIRKIVYIEVKL